MKILAVDDDADVRNLIDTALKNAGHEVTTAFDGNGALEAVKDNQFDLILTDVKMPGMSGVELCSALRATDNAESLPIVFMTGQSDNFDYETAENAGGTGFIVKPFTLSRLVETVNSFGTA